MCVSFCEPGGKSLWLAKLARSSHAVTGDGSSGSISAAITKPKSADTTIERSTAPFGTRKPTLRGKLRERDFGRDLEGAKITLNEYLDRWLKTAVKPRVRENTCQDYDGMLRRYIRPSLGETVLAAMQPIDVQTTYQKMIERGMSARTQSPRSGRHCSGVCCSIIPSMASKSRSRPEAKCVRSPWSKRKHLLRLHWPLRMVPRLPSRSQLECDRVSFWG